MIIHQMQEVHPPHTHYCQYQYRKFVKKLGLEKNFISLPGSMFLYPFSMDTSAEKLHVLLVALTTI